MLDKSSIDDALADSIIIAFKDRILVEDMKLLLDDTTRFQFYKINIKQDDKQEVFIRFMTPYFCAGSGCNLMILDEELNFFNRFTDTSVPIIASQEY